MLRIIVPLLLVAPLGGCQANPAAPPPGAQVSELWGQAGERWSPQSRLPDFSFAGYHFGNDPIPAISVTANVRDFGARGDGVSDDTEVFLKAIASLSRGALLIPAGRYRITQVLKIAKGHVVLRGEGPDRTTLVFPKPLREMIGESPTWAGGVQTKGNWSWGGGVLWCEGRDVGEKIADVTVGARRGDTVLAVSNASQIAAGSMIRLVMHEPADGSLGRHLHADAAPAGAGMVKAYGGKLVDWASRVVSVQGTRVTLERPLRLDVRPEWRPELFSSSPTVEEIGLENFSIEFPGTPYEGHFTEKGFNGIFFDGVQHSWVRHVTIVDADNGIVFHPGTPAYDISRWITISGLRLAVQARSKPINGHHGIALEGPHDCLITDFSIDTQFVHDLTVDSVCCGNVFSRGRGRNLCFDHHTYAPYENLFTDIDAGVGDRLWKSGGPADGGPGSAARETLWNIRAATPPAALAPHPQLNIVGMTAWATRKTDQTWIEAIPPAELWPQDLHRAQLARRRGN